MAERMQDGTVKLRNGKIMYGNSIPMLEDWPELIEFFRYPPQAAPLRTAPESMPVIESLFKDGGRVYTFKLESGKEYASLTVDATILMSIDISVIDDRRAIQDVRKVLEIQDPESGAGMWLHACLQAMKKTFPERKKGRS